MKIEYGIERKGVMVADISHKFDKAWSVDDQADMVMRKIFVKFPYAGDFTWYVREEEVGQICATVFKIEV